MKISIILACLLSSLFFLSIRCVDQNNDATFSSFTHDAWPKELWNEDLQCYLHSWPTNEALRLQKDGAFLKVISVCLFRPPLKLRNKGQGGTFGGNHQVLIYVNGLKRLIEHVHAVFPDWILRIYYDASLFVPGESETELCSSALEQIKTDKSVQLVQYYFPKFAENGDNYHHQSLFGTLVRFLAVFDPAITASFMRDIDMGLSIYDKKKIDMWLTTTNKDFWFYHNENHIGKYCFPWLSEDGIYGFAGMWAARHQGIVLWQEMLAILIDVVCNPNSAIKTFWNRQSCSRGVDEFLLNYCIVLKRQKDIAIYSNVTKKMQSLIQDGDAI